MLNNSGESGHPCLVPDLRGNALFFTIENDVCCGFLVYAFIMLRLPGLPRSALPGGRGAAAAGEGAPPHAPGFGVACHLGVLTDLPCIGVAKKLLQVDGLENNALHKEKIRLLKAGGDSFPLMGGSGTVLGMALKSHDHSTKPLYVSVGHKMSLEAAVRLTHGCCKFRIPEPVRQADIRSRDYIRRTLGVQGAPALQPERSKKAQRPKACPQGVSEEPAVSCCVVNCSVKSTWQRTEPTCQSPCEGAILEVHPPALLKPSDAPSPGCHLTATS
ncbi:endonuclease V isoform X4 [Eschrichtius robustus]|uniref:endonuclease V isoform X4 n=1 Tax=Eschrichtius robustus TaxID=9764 RepID=UPI0035C1242E